MITVSNFDPREEFYKYFDFLKVIYLDNDSFIKNNNRKGSESLKSKKDKFLFKNDPFYRFITEFHFVEYDDIVGANNKQQIDLYLSGLKGNKVPELKDSYLKFGVENYGKLTNENHIEIDPIYLIWIEQVKIYFSELKDFAKLYFGEFNFSINSPYEFYLFMNNELIKLRRRAKLIETLYKMNPSIIEVNKGKKGAYYAIRCNKIDACGDPHRDSIYRIKDIGKITIPEKEKKIKHKTENFIPKNRKYKGMSAQYYNPEIFAEEICGVINVHFNINIISNLVANSKNRVNKYFMLVDNDMIELDLSANHLTLPKVLSIIEFGELYKEYIELYK